MKIHIVQHINAPLALTFNVFSNVQRLEQRFDKITKVEILSDNKVGSGTHWRETHRLDDHDSTTYELKIGSYSLNEKYTLVPIEGDSNYYTSYTFTEHVVGTQVDVLVSYQAKGLIERLMLPIEYLLKNTTQAALEAHIDDIKQVCEHEAQASNR